MPARLKKTLQIGLLLSLAFLLGGASTEVALRTHRAVERVRVVRELGTAGQLVSLQLTGRGGEVMARPRIIAPAGKAAELVLHDPTRPGEIRLAFRVEAERSPDGDISLDYELWVPQRALTTRGRVCLAPGVEQAITLPDGELVATWLAVPVPSAQFDAFIEAERAARRRSVRKAI
jgi:hypothetical protein